MSGRSAIAQRALTESTVPVKPAVESKNESEITEPSSRSAIAVKPVIESEIEEIEQDERDPSAIAVKPVIKSEIEEMEQDEPDLSLWENEFCDSNRQTVVEVDDSRQTAVDDASISSIDDSSVEIDQDDASISSIDDLSEEIEPIEVLRKEGSFCMLGLPSFTFRKQQEARKEHYKLRFVQDSSTRAVISSEDSIEQEFTVKYRGVHLKKPSCTPSNSPVKPSELKEEPTKVESQQVHMSCNKTPPPSSGSTVRAFIQRIEQKSIELEPSEVKSDVEIVTSTALIVAEKKESPRGKLMLGYPTLPDNIRHVSPVEFDLKPSIAVPQSSIDPKSVNPSTALIVVEKSKGSRSAAVSDLVKKKILEIAKSTTKESIEVSKKEAVESIKEDDKAAERILPKKGDLKLLKKKEPAIDSMKKENDLVKPKVLRLEQKEIATQVIQKKDVESSFERKEEAVDLIKKFDMVYERKEKALGTPAMDSMKKENDIVKQKLEQKKDVESIVAVESSFERKEEAIDLIKKVDRPKTSKESLVYERKEKALGTPSIDSIKKEVKAIKGDHVKPVDSTANIILPKQLSNKVQSLERKEKAIRAAECDHAKPKVVNEGLEFSKEKQVVMSQRPGDAGLNHRSSLDKIVASEVPAMTAVPKPKSNFVPKVKVLSQGPVEVTTKSNEPGKSKHIDAFPPPSAKCDDDYGRAASPVSAGAQIMDLTMALNRKEPVPNESIRIHRMTQGQDALTSIQNYREKLSLLRKSPKKGKSREIKTSQTAFKSELQGFSALIPIEDSSLKIHPKELEKNSVCVQMKEQLGPAPLSVNCQSELLDENSVRAQIKKQLAIKMRKSQTEPSGDSKYAADLIKEQVISKMTEMKADRVFGGKLRYKPRVHLAAKLVALKKKRIIAKRPAVVVPEDMDTVSMLLATGTAVDQEHVAMDQTDTRSIDVDTISMLLSTGFASGIDRAIPSPPGIELLKETEQQCMETIREYISNQVSPSASPSNAPNAVRETITEVEEFATRLNIQYRAAQTLAASFRREKFDLESLAARDIGYEKKIASPVLRKKNKRTRPEKPKCVWTGCNQIRQARGLCIHHFRIQFIGMK